MIRSTMLQKIENKLLSILRNVAACFDQINPENIKNPQETLIHINNIRNEILKKRDELKALI